MTSVSHSYDYSLGYYGTIAMKLLVIYPPEVVCCIIRHVKEKENKEAMNYHCKRSCLSMPYHLASDYSHFMKHDFKHRSITEDIRILNEPFFLDRYTIIIKYLYIMVIKKISNCYKNFILF